MENRLARIHILESKEEDRISQLPEPILLRILCSLTQKEAIKTCVLSKAWRYLGRNRPKIEFGFVWGGTSDVSELVRILQGYHDRNLRLDEFNLWLSYGEDDRADTASLLNKWIPTIIQSMCVKTFKLYLYSRFKVELPSVILESHHIHNLSLQGCIFESWSSTTRDQVRRVDLKHLRILDLSLVYIPEEILENVLSNCPFIENVSISYCQGFTRIKLLSSRHENLTHFCFDRYHNHHHPQVSIEIENGIQTLKNIEFSHCLLSVSHPKSLLSGFFSCNLTRLYLHDVYIPEEILDSILSNCPFLEDVSLSNCKGFRAIKLFVNNNNNKPTKLALFCFRDSVGRDVGIEIENDMQTLKTIEIKSCLFSVSRIKPFDLAHLTRLSLTKVKLSSESFSCNLHSLVELELDECFSIKEFKLSSRSMERLSIYNISRPFKATIDAPSIVSFNYEGILPQSISFASGPKTSPEDLWESKLKLESSSSDHKPSHCFNELYGLLKTVSQSKITLSLDQIQIGWFGEDITNDDDIVGVSEEEAKHELPVAVEHLTIKSSDRSIHSNTAPFFKKLFHVFRPSFISMDTGMWAYPNNKYACDIAALLLKERERMQSYSSQRVLEGVGLQALYFDQNEWEPVEYTSFTEASDNAADGKLRIHLKWIDRNEGPC